MSFCKISQDLKLAAVRLYEQDLLPLADILACLNISESTFYCVLALWNTTGDVVCHTFGIHSHPCILHFNDVNYLKCLVKHWPNWFLDELLSLLQTNRFISAHYTTIHRELVHANISTEKLKTIATKRNENLWADFIWCMAEYLPKQIGFLDEVSKDERTSSHHQGQSRKGTCAIKKGVFVCGCCFSAEGLLSKESQSMGWSPILLLRVQWLECDFLNIWSSKWCCIIISLWFWCIYAWLIH